MLSCIHKNLTDSSAARRALLILCIALCAACRVDAADTSTQHSSNFLPGINAYFAIADFDGDRQPDLAIIEARTGGSARTTQYSIRFQMSAGAAQVFGLTAPAGGLQIVARDVNGDNALDVLVSTALQHKQVAVLLNDGHGNFTLADPGIFPAVIQESGKLWNSGAFPLCDSTVLVRSESSAGKVELLDAFDGAPRQIGRAHVSNSTGSPRIFLFQLLGRAPPAFVLPS